MLQKGNRLVEDNGGRGTAALAGGHQTDLRLENLVLTSKAVCGNAVMIFQLTVIGQPKETNRINNFYILPVFVDCWGKTCQFDRWNLKV